jgi:outer membrane protein OmpA-like peptidoglycan-associated protein
MKKTLAFILLLLFLILAWFSWKWYKETVICCGDKEVSASANYSPLIFDCNTLEVVTNESWSEKKLEILDSRPKGKKLLLVGPYFGTESYKNGVTRAENVKALFTELASDEVYTTARFITDCETSKENMLHDLKYKWITRNDDIIEYFDKTMVFYKYDSTAEISNEQVLQYFDELSSFLKLSGDSVMITGHTDNVGEEKYNMELGLRRAAEHKEHLVSLGVVEGKISIQSKGETMPFKPNDTEENKRLNRRVEVHIIE